MAYLPVNIPAGVLRSGTEYKSRYRWYDAHLVRWADGLTLGPIGGWTTKSTSAATGSARAIVTWRANDGVRRGAIGTHSKLYAMSSDGVLTDITPVGFTSGRSDATTLIGYGKGTYGAHAYGTPRQDTGNVLPATVWDLDIWGQYLVGCSHDDGKLYEYQNTGVAATITNAPTGCYGLVVAPQRFVIALGASSNPRKVQWSGQGDNTVWTPAATNQAGSNEIPEGKLICGRVVGSQTFLLSDLDAHVLDYIGLPDVFSLRKVGDACGAISKGCMVTTGSFAAWWSKSGFWKYDGAVTPLRCDVWDDLLRNLTVAQQSKISGFHNAKPGEIWWFYPHGALENTNYIYWNYKHDYWANGTLARLCGCEPTVFETPFCVASDGTVYNHEIGFQYSGSTPFARSGPIELGNGDRTMHVLGIIPDGRTLGDVGISFRTRLYPNATESTIAQVTCSHGRADLRFSARQVEMVISASGTPDWRFGDARLDVRPGGKRGTAH